MDRPHPAPPLTPPRGSARRRPVSPTGPAGPLPRPSHLVALGQAALLAALPDGGQRGARRNAWAGMSADTARVRAHREADAAIAQAQARHRPAAAQG